MTSKNEGVSAIAEPIALNFFSASSLIPELQPRAFSEIRAAANTVTGAATNTGGANTGGANTGGATTAAAAAVAAAAAAAAAARTLPPPLWPRAARAVGRAIPTAALPLLPCADTPPTRPPELGLHAGGLGSVYATIAYYSTPL